MNDNSCMLAGQTLQNVMNLMIIHVHDCTVLLLLYNNYYYLTYAFWFSFMIITFLVVHQCEQEIINVVGGWSCYCISQ